MTSSLFIRNQQRTFPINIRYLRWMTKELLQDHLWIDDYDLAIYIVRAPRMAEINQTHLQHDGPTDVITFNYSEERVSPPAQAQARSGTVRSETKLHGEIFVCIDVARTQAGEFRTTWQSELVRYVIHGILHLCGYDDLTPAARRVMKREENRLVKRLAFSHPPQKLAPGRR